MLSIQILNDKYQNLKNDARIYKIDTNRHILTDLDKFYEVEKKTEVELDLEIIEFFHFSPECNRATKINT